MDKKLFFSKSGFFARCWISEPAGAWMRTVTSQTELKKSRTSTLLPHMCTGPTSIHLLRYTRCSQQTQVLDENENQLASLLSIRAFSVHQLQSLVCLCSGRVVSNIALTVTNCINTFVYTQRLVYVETINAIGRPQVLCLFGGVVHRSDHRQQNDTLVPTRIHLGATRFEVHCQLITATSFHLFFRRRRSFFTDTHLVESEKDRY